MELEWKFGYVNRKIETGMRIGNETSNEEKDGKKIWNLSQTRSGNGIGNMNGNGKGSENWIECYSPYRTDSMF